MTVDWSAIRDIPPLEPVIHTITVWIRTYDPDAPKWDADPPKEIRGTTRGVPWILFD